MREGVEYIFWKSNFLLAPLIWGILYSHHPNFGAFGAIFFTAPPFGGLGAEKFCYRPSNTPPLPQELSGHSLSSAVLEYKAIQTPRWGDHFSKNSIRYPNTRLVNLTTQWANITSLLNVAYIIHWIFCCIGWNPGRTYKLEPSLPSSKSQRAFHARSFQKNPHAEILHAKQET